jgi:predicted DNA-binding transcriptional regulator YafY
MDLSGGNMGERLYFERFLWFDGEIKRGRYPNATHLAEHFECSAKTAQRTIDYFRDRLCAPLEYDSSRKGFYYAKPGWQLPAMRLSEEELLALLVSRKLLSDVAAGPLSDELGHVTDRLRVLLAEHVTGRIRPDDAFSFRWKEVAPSGHAIFHLVSSALLKTRLLAFCYYSPSSSQCTVRTVEPHHMVNYMGTWHLVAYCRTRNDWRDFQLSRMSDCRVEDEGFIPHEEGEWKPFLTDTFGIFQNREFFEVILRFSPERARWVRGEVWHPSQRVEELPDGSLILALPVSHEAEIMMEVLRHGSHVEMLEPEWLREKVRQEIERMGKIYDTGYPGDG